LKIRKLNIDVKTAGMGINQYMPFLAWRRNAMRDGGAAVKLTDGQGTHIQAPCSPRLMGGGHLRPGCRVRHSKPSKPRHFSPLPTVGCQLNIKCRHIFTVNNFRILRFLHEIAISMAADG